MQLQGNLLRQLKARYSRSAWGCVRRGRERHGGQGVAALSTVVMPDLSGPRGLVELRTPTITCEKELRTGKIGCNSTIVSVTQPYTVDPKLRGYGCVHLGTGYQHGYQ